jgi:hypothetical protein
MRDITSDNYAALQARRLVARDFLSIQARTLDTAEPVWAHQWSDIGTFTADVIDPDTSETSTREFVGSGTLVSIDAIPLVSNLTVQNTTITMSQVNDVVANLVRGYDCKQAVVQIFRGLFDPIARNLVSPAMPRFVGYVDTIVINTPTENTDGNVTLTCSSSTQEMTRSNPDTRSQQSQIARAAGDNFYHDTDVVGTWVLFWGQTNGAVVNPLLAIKGAIG